MMLNRRQFLPLIGLAMFFSVGGCSLTENYPLGRLSVQVLDPSNTGMSGVLLDLYKLEGGDPIYWRATATSSSGRGEFGERDGGVIAGDYFVRVVFRTNHELAPGETNDRPITVREGDQILLTFRARPIAIDPPAQP